MNGTKLPLAVCLLATFACGSPQEQPNAPAAAATPPAAASAVATPPAAQVPATVPANSPDPSSMLRPVSLVPLQVVPGNPRLLVGHMQVYEWRDTGIVAKPRLLAEAFSQVDLQGDMGFPYALQGTYPTNLYVQVKRIRFGAPGIHERVLRWSKDRWQPLAGPLGDTQQTVVMLESERGTLAVGCVKERCFFQPVAGTPLVPKFSWQAGCSTRMSAVIGAAIDQSGTLHVLGNECSTGRVLVESWPKGATQSRVEVLSAATPRPAGDYEPTDIGIAVFENEPWVWGLEWLWSDGPVTQTLLSHRADGAWPLEQLACDEQPVRGFVAWRGYQFAVCDTLALRPPGGSWGATKLKASHPQLVDGQLVFEHDGGLSRFVPPEASADAALSFDLPCAGHFIDLGIGKDVAGARKFIRRLGDARKEMVLAMAGDRPTMFLIAPDLDTGYAAASTLGLQSEPECLLEDFHTFVAPD